MIILVSCNAKKDLTPRVRFHFTPDVKKAMLHSIQLGLEICYKPECLDSIFKCLLNKVGMYRFSMDYVMCN